MQSIIYFILALVAITSAGRLNPGPQAFTESSGSSKTNDKRFATHEITLYLTPSEIKALQEAKKAENKEAQADPLREKQQFTLQSFDQEPELNDWLKYTKLSQVEQPQEFNQELISENSFFQNAKPVFENQEESFDPFNVYKKQEANEQHAQNNQQDSDKKGFEWISYNPVSAKAQEESLIHEQLQQHWNRILEHNRAQLKALKAKDEKQNSENLKENKKSSRSQWQTSSDSDEETRAEIEKEIEYSLRHQQAFDFEQKRSRGEEQSSNQRSPILIHKEVRVTKHLPVNVVEKVKVSVPTPVLVPVPEPYEVKVPHPYPVPLEIIKHIPVPVIRKY